MHLTENNKGQSAISGVWYHTCGLSQQCTCAGLLLVVGISSSSFFPVGIIELVKQFGFDHLLLPRNGHGARAELLKEFVVLGVKLNALDLGELGDVARVLGVDHVRLGHPGGIHQPGLQTGEVNGLEPRVLPGILQVVPSEKNTNLKTLVLQTPLKGLKNKQKIK